MTSKMDDAQSYHLGWGVAREHARTLGIELVCAITMDVLQHLDPCVHGITDCDVPEHVDEAQYRRGFAEGLRAACGEIIKRVDATLLK